MALIFLEQQIATCYIASIHTLFKYYLIFTSSITMKIFSIHKDNNTILRKHFEIIDFRHYVCDIILL